ncbi:MAG: serine hydrolase domain-containing protein [Pseudomonadales bacterium]|jgi:CubicO group peptidase (beta-lactamase class C family)|nr:serine hydrolase domain-containing protein [Pseudomonadales bacterium]HJN51316.1 serine hydrolase domain-containing protein [Pseudomonadales bacterium]
MSGATRPRIEKAETGPQEVGMSGSKLKNLTNLVQSYVDDGKVPGAVCMVARDGKVVHHTIHGNMDDEAGKPMADDTIFRIYSMTKPIASIALMMLYEEGSFQLDEPAGNLIPELTDLKVFDGGTVDDYQVRDPTRAMTIRDLLMHCSGLIGSGGETPVGELYRRAELRAGDGTLASMVERLGELPLYCDPGSEWNYGISTDLVGYLCEVISGQPFDQYLQERIFDPLDMPDTGFQVPEHHVDRFAACYRRGGEDEASYVLSDPPADSIYIKPRTYFSGAGGLVSTAHDYLNFCKMLCNGGELQGERIIGSRTLEYMSANHLPDNCDLAAMGQPRFTETTMEGIGFGLGFAVLLDPTVAQVIGTSGEYYWGGAASTAFFISPEEDLALLFLTQLLPSGCYPFRRQLRAAVYGAIAD